MNTLRVVKDGPRPRRVLLVAVEPSADLLGAALLRELRAAMPNAEFAGCGGPAMAAAGVKSLFPIERLSVVGFTDVARAVPEAYRRAAELTKLVAEENCDAVVFIDGWAFSRLCAHRMRRRAPGVKLFKFGAPQIWASRPQRVGFVRSHFDGVLCLLPFEPALFRDAGVKAEFIGNPNFQAAWAARGDAAGFRKRHDLRDAKLLAVLPGSRRSEVKQHLEPFEGAVRMLADRVPGMRVVAVIPPALAGVATPVISQWPGSPIIAEPDEKWRAFAAADAALAKSGTVTTELAINRTPMVVAYRVDALTALWARRVVKTPFVTVLNVVAGRFVIPELIQEECRPELLAGALLPLLTDDERRLDQLDAFPPLLAKLAVNGPPAARLGAAHLAQWIEDGPRAARSPSTDPVS